MRASAGSDSAFLVNPSCLCRNRFSAAIELSDREEDALRCYVRSGLCQSRERRNEFLAARAWFYTRGAPDVFSFESVCSFLDINPKLVRARLQLLSPADFPRKQFHATRRRPRRPSSRIARQDFESRRS